MYFRGMVQIFLFALFARVTVNKKIDIDRMFEEAGIRMWLA